MNELKAEGVGFKFLHPSCCTYHGGVAFPYPIPAPGEKWGPWFEHPNPAQPDGSPCGPGRIHVMLSLNARYAPSVWWPWWVQWAGEIGRDGNKVAVRWCRLRRITKRAFWQALRPPCNWGQRANLRDADLRYANLRDANLGYANLRDADLRYADLRYANLRDANLRNANLRDADLRYANLRYADLWDADLWGADLRYADLRYANLRDADLRYATLRYADLWDADLRGADLWGADLEGANVNLARKD